MICALVYFVLNSIPWLANLGRREQGKKNTVFEDFAQEIQRLTMVHHTGRNPGDPDTYQFVDREFFLSVFPSPAS